MIEIIRTESTDTDFRNLIAELDHELYDRYGEAQNNLDTHNKIEACDTVIIGSLDNKMVGCGCFKKIDQDTVEIKRMFVRKDYRGQGISKTILVELETWAQEYGFKYVILETGNKQPEAIGLYEKSGYQQIDNY